MSQILVKQIISNCLVELKNTNALVQTYLFANPYLIKQKQNIGYPFIGLSKKLEEGIDQFNKLIIKNRIAPNIWTCQIIKKSFIFSLSYTNTFYSEQLLIKKVQNLEECLNDKIRELNENQLQQKQVRNLLISTRNNLQNFSKQLKDRSNGFMNKNQTVSKIIEYLI